MKIKYILLVLIIFAWPLYYLYGLQLGAVSFLLLALFFIVVTIKEVKKDKHQNGIELEGKQERKNQAKH